MLILADHPALSPGESGELPDALRYLLNRCPQAVVIATLREEFCPQDLRSLKVFRLSREKNAEIYRPLAQAVAQAEARQTGRTASEEDADKVLRRFSGFPGSLVAAIDVMKDEFDRPTDEERGFLQTAQILTQFGIRHLTISRI